MSNAVATLVYSRVVGSLARKAVLRYFADRASDDGRGIWASKQRIADEIECSRQTVITVVRGLIADGLVAEVGERRCRFGFTVEYRLVLPAIAALPATRPDNEGVQFWTPSNLDPSTSFTGTRQTPLPEPHKNHPTPEDADASSAPRRKKRASRMQSDWRAPGIEALPEPARSIARQWPDGAYEAKAAGHRDHMIGTGRRAIDHDAAWVARVVQLGAGPIREARSGLRFAAIELPAAPPSAEAIARSIAGYERIGDHAMAEALRRRHGIAEPTNRIDEIRHASRDFGFTDRHKRYRDLPEYWGSPRLPFARNETVADVQVGRKSLRARFLAERTFR
ncbi:helix-turn-helix domain-containing protein [Sphingomonas panni]